MTVRKLLQGVLIETRNEESPDLHLEEFNYYLNIVVDEFIRNNYLAFETTQKVTDYLSPLKKTTQFTDFTNVESTFRNGYIFNLPEDYRHLTDVVICYEVIKNTSDICLKPGDTYCKGAKKLTSDTEGSIMDDPGQQPIYYRPYYQIFSQQELYSSPQNNKEPGLNSLTETKTVQKMRVILGKLDTTKLIPTGVFIDYLRKPKTYNLTYQQAYIDVEDNSQSLEFTDQGAYSIQRDLITRILERNQDPRTQSQMQISATRPNLETKNK